MVKDKGRLTFCQTMYRSCTISIAVFSVLIFKGLTTLISPNICPAKTNTYLNIYWPPTNSCVFSEPPCSDGRSIIQRCCHDGEWEPDTCILAYSSDFDIYYHRLHNTKFPVECTFKRTLPFDKYAKLVDQLKLAPVWMPVQRNLSDGIGLMYWIEISDRYMLSEDAYSFRETSIADDGCLVYLNESNYQAVFCNSTYNAICAYDGESIAKYAVKNSSTKRIFNTVEPDLSLSLGKDGNFSVKLKNCLGQQFQLFCFTDASRFRPIYRYHLDEVICDEENRVIQSFSPHNDGSGYYWCEAFVEADRSKLITNTIFYDDGAHEYVARLRHKYIFGTNPLTIEHFLMFLELLKFSAKKNLGKLRIFKVESINERIEEVIFNMHLSVQPSHLTVPEEYSQVFDDFKEMVSKNELLLNIEIVEILSSNYCIGGKELHNNISLTWPLTPLGQYANPKELCLTKDGVLVRRFCDGDFINSAKWDAFEETCFQPSDDYISVLTPDLINLLNESASNSETLKSLSKITQKSHLMKSVDINLVSHILEKIHGDQLVNLDLIGEVISNVMNVNQAALELAQNMMGATDRILYFLDVILFNRLLMTNLIKYVKEHISIAKISLDKLEVEEIFLHNSDNTTTIVQFNNYINEEKLEKVFNLDSVILIPSNLVTQIKKFIVTPTIIVTRFNLNNLFNEVNEANGSHKSTSKIISILIPNFTKKFSAPIQLLYPVDNQFIEGECSFWNYASERRGFWDKDHDSHRVKKFRKCEYNHLTHFALLLIDNDELVDQYETLSLITHVNCCLSILGLSAVFLTAIFYKEWRRNIGNKILLNYSFAIFMQIILMFSSKVVKDFRSGSILCTIVGVALHFMLLASFCWTLVIAVLQFKRFVEVFGGPPKWILLRSCLCGWVPPMLPLILILVFDQGSYADNINYLCYPTGYGLYLGIVAPISVIVFINIIIYIYIVYSVFHRRVEYVDNGNNEKFLQWRLAFLLFFILGFSWIFGFLAYIGWGIFFNYLFCFTSTLQGFIIFLFFIAMNKKTRKMYLKTFRKH